MPVNSVKHIKISKTNHLLLPRKFSKAKYHEIEEYKAGFYVVSS